jgi:N-acetylated-alpha-linked acidic dipeptidase
LSVEEAHHHTNPLEGVELPNIPIQPMGSADAIHLLRGLQGSQVPNASSWGGGFNLSFVGPGPVEVYMKIEVTFPVTPIWNVLASVRGQTEPDRYVIIGCHRDAWTYGAQDPISGHSVLLEVARAMSELIKTGWQPKRTIIFASYISDPD